MLKNLEAVNKDVLPFFSEAAKVILTIQPIIAINFEL